MQLPKIISNITTVMSSDVVNRASTFFLYVLVAREYGEYELGQFSLGLTYFFLFQVFSEAGLKTSIIRDVAKDKDKANDYLLHGSIAVVFSSAISISVLLVCMWFMGYNPETTDFILFVSLGLLPRALSSICESVFKGREDMEMIAYANIPISLIKLGLAYLLVESGYGIFHLAALLIATHIAILAIEWVIYYFRYDQVHFNWQFSSCVAILRKAFTFLLMNSTLALSGSLGFLILSKLENEQTVGILAAINQLMLPVTLVFRSTITGVYPIMCRKFKQNFSNLSTIVQYLTGALLILAIPTSTWLFFMGDSALTFIYDFEIPPEAIYALQLIALLPIASALTSSLGQGLVATNMEKVNLRILVINLVISLPLSIALISQFGLVGAALNKVLLSLISFGQHYYIVSRVIPGLSLHKMVWKPLIACLLLAVFLSQIGQNIHLLAATVIGGLIYLGGLLLLNLWHLGNIRNLRTIYSRIVSV